MNPGMQKMPKKLQILLLLKCVIQKEDQILTDWNGLMIAALAKASQAFHEPGYAKNAQKAADFIITKMRNPKGGLYHRYRDGETAIPGFLDDYGFFVWGCSNFMRQPSRSVT